MPCDLEIAPRERGLHLLYAMLDQAADSVGLAKI
jgi:hypothetical protein